MEFSNIPKNLPNGENMGGITQKVYYALYDDVATWPTKPTSPATLEANAALTGDIVMDSGKGFYELYITDDTGEFKIECVGEKDGKSFVETLGLFHPGLGTKILGLINVAKNENLVLIVEDNNGAKFLMGDENRPATFDKGGNMGTGKETNARRGLEMEFTYKTSNIYVYTGSIPLAGAGSGSN